MVIPSIVVFSAAVRIESNSHCTLINVMLRISTFNIKWMIQPMFIIRYRRICEIGVRELVPGQGAVTKYPDERAGVILSSVPIVHRAINHSVPRYVVTSILDGFIKSLNNQKLSPTTGMHLKDIVNYLNLVHPG